ncbi:proline--tRNA ligase [Mycoplasmatota bacterium zrk1]
MKQSMMFIPTLKNAPKDAEAMSHKLLVRSGLVKQVAAGIYSYLPLGYKVIKIIENIVREELDALGCSELLLPALQTSDLWKESGRWDDYGPELMRLKDRKDRDFCLGPTHEEVITFVARDYLNSYKKLPVALYQIQTKFRDEMRPRFALMRGREFSMKDLYSFHSNDECLNEWYELVWEAYKKIFNRCGLEVKVVDSDTGQIGGKEAHEFMVMSEVGEDTISYCNDCDYGSNTEFSNLAEGDKCPKCGGTISIAKGIEVGNIFKLGTKYSDPMKATFTDKDGKEKPMIMGCYGLGVSRTLMAVVEQNNDELGIVWPEELKPFKYHIICFDVKNKEQLDVANHIYSELRKQSECLFDDRIERGIIKLKDSDLIGIPIRITVGRDIKDGIVEVTERKTGESSKIKITDLQAFCSSLSKKKKK